MIVGILLIRNIKSKVKNNNYYLMEKEKKIVSFYS